MRHAWEEWHLRLPGILESHSWFKFFAAQDEVSPETGRRHLQACCFVDPKKSANQVCRLLGFVNPYVARVRGKPEEAADYCTDGPLSQEAQAKKGKAPIKRMPGGNVLRWGVLPEVSQGTRTDIAKFVRLASTPNTLFTTLCSDPEVQTAALRYVRAFEKLQYEAMGKAQPRPDLRVTFCFGPSNCGKSLCTGSKVLPPLVELPDDPYLAEVEGKFWLAYGGQKKIIFDDVTGASFTPRLFQRVCDTTPFTCNVKSTDRPFNGTDVRLSSNFMPDRWWDVSVKADHKAIATRIHECHHHWKTEDGQYMVAKYWYADKGGRETLGPRDLCPVERMSLDLDALREVTHDRADFVGPVVYAPQTPPASPPASAPGSPLRSSTSATGSASEDEDNIPPGPSNRKRKAFYD